MPLETFALYVLAGFVAQLIDGALGMAFGVTASSLLLSFGVPPVATSATVHAAECVTTGVSALSHRAFRNYDRALVRKLLVPGVAGALIGAFALSQFPGESLRPLIALYLAGLGVVIITRAFRHAPAHAPVSRLGTLGFFGALIDAIGGGGWGPIVASNLLARGHDARTTIGSVNIVEFFVTLSASLVFLLTLGLTHWQITAGLAFGGALAAPLGAWTTRRLPVKPLMIGVGVLIIALSARTIAGALAR
jgi:hypothetical protein